MTLTVTLMITGDYSPFTSTTVLELLCWRYCCVAGHHISTCTSYYVSLCRQVLNDEHDNYLSAVSTMFASYFVFNYSYNPKCVATLEYMQR